MTEQFETAFLAGASPVAVLWVIYALRVMFSPPGRVEMDGGANAMGIFCVFFVAAYYWLGGV